MPKRNDWIAGLAIALLAPIAAGAQMIEAELDQVEAQLTLAKAGELHLVAPRNFEKASEKFAEAKQRYEAGGKIENIRSRLKESMDALEKAREFEEVGKVLLEKALVARRDALQANAPEFATALWEEAKKTMLDAGREVEDGDQSGARKKAVKATSGFRSAELEAIRRDLLGRANQLRTEALAREANEKAAVTFGQAESYLRRAEEVLKSDRYQRAEARSLAHAAANEFRHAAYIAKIVDEAEDDERAIERVILANEKSMAEVTKSLGLEVAFTEGIDGAAQRAASAIAGLSDDRDNLRRELQAARAELVERNSELAALGAKGAALTTELEARRRREETIRQVRTLFSSDQAQVLEGDDELILRVVGLSFPVGSSEIQPADFPLLTDIQRALRKFPDSRVIIEGHTDSRGDEDYNQALSQRRADAVTAYLLANMGTDGERFTAVGYGETNPVASNDSEAGRAKNRRIDVRLKLATSTASGPIGSVTGSSGP